MSKTKDWALEDTDKPNKEKESELSGEERAKLIEDLMRIYSDELTEDCYIKKEKDPITKETNQN